MILLPCHLLDQYRSFFANSGVMDRDIADYLKWLCYFWKVLAIHVFGFLIF
jgi:hypothetical protein